MRKKWLFSAILLIVLFAISYYAYQNYMEIQRYEQIEAYNKHAAETGGIPFAPAPPQVIYTMLAVVAVLIVIFLGIIVKMR
jgi:uncharacterized membrane protein